MWFEICEMGLEDRSCVLRVCLDGDGRRSVFLFSRVLLLI